MWGREYGAGDELVWGLCHCGVGVLRGGGALIKWE